MMETNLAGCKFILLYIFLIHNLFLRYESNIQGNVENGIFIILDIDHIKKNLVGLLMHFYMETLMNMNLIGQESYPDITRRMYEVGFL